MIYNYILSGVLSTITITKQCLLPVTFNLNKKNYSNLKIVLQGDGSQLVQETIHRFVNKNNDETLIVKG